MIRIELVSLFESATDHLYGVAGSLLVPIIIMMPARADLASLVFTFKSGNNCLHIKLLLNKYGPNMGAVIVNFFKLKSVVTILDADDQSRQLIIGAISFWLDKYLPDSVLPV